MTPLRNFNLVHFRPQLFGGIGGGGVVAPPEPPIPGGGGGSGAFDAHKYRIKKPEEPECAAPDPEILCISLHHVGAQWGLVARTTQSPKPTRQQQHMVVAMFIAQHGSP